MASVVAIALLFVAGAWPADASVFLGSHSHLGSGNRLMSKSAVEQLLFSELGAASNVHADLEDELRPMYMAMPKNEQGNLEPSVTRYVLHRYFAQKYGWSMVGLEPAGAAWDASSPGSIIKNRVPVYIQALFEQRMHGQGFGLSELAVFAATLLDLIYKESVEDLEAVYAALTMPTSAKLMPGPVQTLVKSYTILYFHGMNAAAGDNSSLSSLSFRKMNQQLSDEFISWQDVSLWANDIGKTVAWKQAQRNSFVRGSSFDSVAEFARELAHNFGSFQNLECKSLKRQLMKMEYRGTGRVRLSEFHSGANDSSWHFVESVDYLHALGALDQSDAGQPRVIIPNFLSSQTNCVTPSDFYSVCCLNECEQLMASLERAIQGPLAEPQHIADVVAALPSDTVGAPRRLPAVQLKRLEEIASQHGGQVPLHGRLFAQWMHHAYPRECPYPHIAGTTNPLSPDEWIAKVGTTAASEDEMAWNAARRSGGKELKTAMTLEAMTEELPWISVEELVAPQRQPNEYRKYLPLQMVGLLAGIVVSALRVARASWSAWHSVDGGKLEKHLV